MYGLRVEFTENLGAKYREFQRIDNEYIIKYNLSEILSDKSEIVLLMNCIYFLNCWTIIVGLLLSIRMLRIHL